MTFEPLRTSMSFENLGIDLAWEILAGEKDFAWGAGLVRKKELAWGADLAVGRVEETSMARGRLRLRF